MLYILKRQHGVYGQLYQVGAYNSNYKTGVINRTVQSVNIEAIIRLGNGTTFEALVAALRIPDAQQQNTEGFLIDCDDLPAGWTVAPKDYIIIDGKEYTIFKVNYIDHLNAVYVKGHQTSSTIRRAINISASTVINIQVDRTTRMQTGTIYQ